MKQAQIAEGRSQRKIKEVINDKSNNKGSEFLTPKLIVSISLLALVFVFYLLFKPSYGLEKQTIIDNSNQNKKEPDYYLSDRSSASKEISEENNFLEKDILSKQKNDAHAEKFAREELNLIFEDEDFLRFKETKSNEPQG